MLLKEIFFCQSLQLLTSFVAGTNRMHLNNSIFLSDSRDRINKKERSLTDELVRWK